MDFFLVLALKSVLGKSRRLEWTDCNYADFSLPISFHVLALLCETLASEA